VYTTNPQVFRDYSHLRNKLQEVQLCLTCHPNASIYASGGIMPHVAASRLVDVAARPSHYKKASGFCDVLPTHLPFNALNESDPLELTGSCLVWKN